MKKNFLKSVVAVLFFSAFVLGQVACDNMGDGDNADDTDTTITTDTTSF